MRYLLLLLCLSFCKLNHAQLSDFGKIDFHQADSIADHYKGESLDNLPLLARNLTKSLPSQVEKFRSIYIWVCKNISNDYASNLRNQKMRKKLSGDSVALAKWNAEIRAEMFRKLLKKQKTLCTGYAYLVRELAVLSGLNCKIIDGYGRTVVSNVGGSGVLNHSWNAVQLDNRWYLCDPTWSSGHTLMPGYTFVHEYFDGYFLADPELFALNHYPLDTNWLLMDKVPELEAFLHAPLIYKEVFTYQMIPLEPSLMKITVLENEGLNFVFQVPDSLNTEDIYLEFGSGKHAYTKKTEISRSKEGHLRIQYPFQKRIPQDVHIKSGEEYLATYTVKMQKPKK